MAQPLKHSSPPCGRRVTPDDRNTSPRISRRASANHTPRPSSLASPPSRREAWRFSLPTSFGVQSFAFYWRARPTSIALWRSLEMLVRKYETGGPVEKGRIASFYIRNLRYVDHWVLVDTSAPYILGDHLMKRRRTLLVELASSRQLAKRRTAIVATWAFIRAHDFADTLRIAELLLHDEHELIHRAVG